VGDRFNILHFLGWMWYPTNGTSSEHEADTHLVGTSPKPYSANDAKRSSQALEMIALRHPRKMVQAMFRHIYECGNAHRHEAAQRRSRIHIRVCLQRRGA
jgi:hypothetical protein